MSLRQSAEEKKWLAFRRAHFRLKQQFDRIDHEEDLLEEFNTLKQAEASLEVKLKELGNGS